jgi:MYXO-CTERM domain-containing protein
MPTVAAAHVRITSPTPRSSTVLKDQHCGQAGLARANVHTALPGSTLHLVWDEYVQHPGWFRISFQKDGDTFEIPPASNGKTGTGNPSNYPTENLTGMTDATTGSLIIADRIVDGTTSADVVLPNIECNNCTLQLIQLMTDKPPYTVDLGSDDIYFACVDLVLSAGAPDAGPGGGIDAGPGGGIDAGTGGGGIDAGPVGTGGNDAGVGGGGGGGGCSVASAGGSGASLLGLTVGLTLARRRRRR